MKNKFNLRAVWTALLMISMFAQIAIPQQAGENNSNESNDASKTLSPYFLVKGDPSVDHLPLKGTNVEIAVSGVIADVRVVQTYQNEGTRPINATYVFPASTRAAVYGMRMKIGDEVIVAKIKEREKAKESQAREFNVEPQVFGDLRD